MAGFVDCWEKHASGLSALDKKSILDRTETYKGEEGLSHDDALKKSLQWHHDQAHSQLQSIYDQVGVKPETPVTPPSTETTGIAARYREDELGPGSVIPGVGRTPDEARAFGQDFINKGGNPYDAINRKGPKRELWQDVGIARAEYERLGNEKRAAESALESDPSNPQLQKAFDAADAKQRQWSKDAQPILTGAGDALRAATRSYPREINTFSDFTDIVNDHFKGEVELTPEKRAELQKAVKAIKKGNAEATEARAKVTDEAVKKAGGKVLPFDDLKSSLQNKMSELLKNCQV